MKWKKLGLVYCPDGNVHWMRSHAANPVVEEIGGDVVRVYFSTRDSENRSSIGWLEIDMRAPTRVLQVSKDPVIGPGRLGAFDDSGTSMGCLVKQGGSRYLYYLGWNLGVTVPFRNTIGLAVSHGGGEFRRYWESPVLDRGPFDPFCLSYPWVLVDGGRWRMWYGSNLNWGTRHSDMAHVLKYAESDDGIHWRRDGRIVVNFQSPDEYAVAKPCVLANKSGYQMWYSYRGAAYRIGYATSNDGLEWRREDEQYGISPSSTGWDSETVCYPCVFEQRGTRYMVYNGNGYGQTGFGIAVLD